MKTTTATATTTSEWLRGLEVGLWLGSEPRPFERADGEDRYYCTLSAQCVRELASLLFMLFVLLFMHCVGVTGACRSSYDNAT